MAVVMRRWGRLLSVLLVLLLLPLTALADSRVVDDAELFTDGEIKQMEALIEDMRATYQMDVAVVTSRQVPYGDTVDFADRYFEEHGYGLGEDRAGLLYLIDMRNRQRWISTAGTMIDFITDGREEGMLDSGEEAMQQGRYGQSTLALLRQLNVYLSEGRQEGSFRYDEATGQRLTGLYNALTRGEMIFALLAGLAVALMIYFSVSFRYNLKGTTYRYDRAHNVHRKLKVDDETFLRQTVSRMPRGSSNGGGGGGGGGLGSGVHMSSGGMSHGGGGRGF